MKNSSVALQGFISSLSPEQNAAATSMAERSLVTAGAGTGKTTTLTARIAWLMAERGLPAQSIIAVTFTNRAARELKERLSSLMGDAASGLRVGTFHGLSARLLRRHWASAGLQGPGFTIADEDEARSIMEKAALSPAAYGPFTPPANANEELVKALRKDWDAGLREFVGKALRQVSLWKSWGLTDDLATDPKRAQRSEAEERFAAAYGAYQYELGVRNMVDFGDLLLKAVTLLKNTPRILEEEAGSVQHLLVDEGQDANPVQVEWAQLMSSVNGGLTVVGDEDQNIYGFQGGYVGAMQDMTGALCDEFTLTVNRRCTEEILRPANLAVDYNRRKSAKELSSGRHGEPVVATGHPSEQAEAAWVAGRIHELVEQGADPGSIAILFRTSHSVRAFEEALTRKSIPTMVTAGRSLLERSEARDIMAMVRIAVDPHDEMAFTRLAATAKGLGPAAVEKITAMAMARSLPFHEALAAACAGDAGIVLRKSAREAALKLSRALYLLSEEGRWGRHSHDMISIGLENLGYREWIASDRKKGADHLAVVETVHALAEDFDDAYDFLHEMSLLTEADGGEAKGRVRLSTMHSVKGLEFDHVFCPAFDADIMPNARSVEEGRRGKPGDVWNGPSGGGIEEERRLAHVAFTRARHTLWVSFAWSRGSYRRKGGGPSSFLEECELEWSDVSPLGGASSSVKRKARAGRVGFDR